ncbi:MAG: hypothetical protein ACR2PT_00260, partial [Endozoicomonas sp.]
HMHYSTEWLDYVYLHDTDLNQIYSVTSYAQHILHAGLEYYGKWLAKKGYSPQELLNHKDVREGAPFFFDFPPESVTKLCALGADFSLQDKLGNNYLTYRKAVTSHEITPEQFEWLTINTKIDSQHCNLAAENFTDILLKNPVYCNGEKGCRLLLAAFESNAPLCHHSDQTMKALNQASLVKKKAALPIVQKEVSRLALAKACPDSPPEHLCIIEVNENNHQDIKSIHRLAPLHTSVFKLDVQSSSLTRLQGDSLLPENTLILVSAHGNATSIGGYSGHHIARTLAEKLKDFCCPGILPKRIELICCNTATSVWKQLHPSALWLTENTACQFAREWHKHADSEIEVIGFDGTALQPYKDSIHPISVYLDEHSRFWLLPLIFSEKAQQPGSEVTVYVNKDGQLRTLSRVLEEPDQGKWSRLFMTH